MNLHRNLSYELSCTILLSYSDTVGYVLVTEGI